MDLPVKIISSRQSGVESAALEAALECGIAVGGSSCPEENIVEADATVVILRSKRSGKKFPRTRQILETLRGRNLPRLVLRLDSGTPEKLLRKLQDWLARTQARTLHITGPSHPEDKDLGNLASYLILRLYGHLPPPRKDRLLKFTAWAVIFANLSPILAGIISPPGRGPASVFEAALPYLLWESIPGIIAGSYLLRGSHSALRFLTFCNGFATALAAPYIFYHVLLLRPFDFQDQWIRPLTAEFVIRILTPFMIVAGLLVLTYLVHSYRYIKFWTRAIKAWTIILSLIVLTLIGHSVKRDRDDLATFSESEIREFERVVAFYERYGSSPPANRLESLHNELAKSKNVAEINLGWRTRFARWRAPSTRFEPCLGRSDCLNTRESEDSITITFESGSPWKGRARVKTVRSNKGEWFQLEVLIGSFVGL